MNVTISPSSIKGTVQAPASKSSMQRACGAALLVKGKTVIKNPGFSNDDKAAMDVMQKLGAKIQIDNGQLIVDSVGVNPGKLEINTGESGLGVRMFTPIAALSDKEILISGYGSLMERPMNFFDEILPKLGVKVESNNGKLPIKIQGPLKPATIEIDGSLSSQFLTGLLMAFSAASPNSSKGGAFKTIANSTVIIKVKNLKSKPYVDLTLDVMKKFGMLVPENKKYEEFIFNYDAEIPASGGGEAYTVEGDWSGGAFLLVAAAVAGDVTVNGLQNTSTQADKKIIDALLDAGADVTVNEKAVHVKKNKLEAFNFDATDCPDLFPPLVALAANCKGISKIRGLKRLKHKESDRGIALKEEFDKLSTQIDLNDDEMLVHGNGRVFVKNHTMNSHNDHRIAMAIAVACLNADFDVEIRNAEAVNKSYPEFYNNMKKLGVNVISHNKETIHE
ncbi:MAG TPA: 3-phosphoshikimate 1-carboxyvinyltransferase [Chitinophagaceae bacterium]|nr:3-phosphoshikimate 1-carboxyvinyltransferase [Chitinophagaceae bacterium]